MSNYHTKSNKPLFILPFLIKFSLELLYTITHIQEDTLILAVGRINIYKQTHTEPTCSLLAEQHLNQDRDTASTHDSPQVSSHHLAFENLRLALLAFELPADRAA